MVYTSTYSNLGKVKDIEKYLLISISLYQPIDFDGINYSSLSPDKSLLEDFKNNRISWKDYCSRYHSEVLRHLNAKYVYQCILDDIESLGYEDAILLCYCHNFNRCHRKLVTEWFRENGIFITEYIV